MCSCEVLLTPVARRGQPASLAWHIACVFTPQHYRGRGHASAMLLALRQLAGPGTPLLLYSDIGQGLYASLSFAPLLQPP